MDKIKEITDPSFRSGTGKTGKPWTMMKILTESGKEASIFAPAQVGDDVILKYNEQYKNYSAELATKARIEKAEEETKLSLIYNLVEETNRLVKQLAGQKTGVDGFRETLSGIAGKQEVIPEIPGSEEVDLTDIPF